MRLARHPAKYVGKYRWKHRALRIRLHRHLRCSLHFDLNLDLNLDLNPSLHRALLAMFYPQLIETFLATMLGSMFAAKRLWFQVQMCLAWYRQVLPPRQPVGRPLPGRIVALIPGHTIPCGYANPSLEYRSHDKSSYQADSLSCHCKFFTLRSLRLTRWK
jgi:hypothetical protein